MSKLKCKTVIIATIMLISLTISAFTVQASSPRTVWGKVYIDGELAPDGTTVKLTFSGQELTNDTYENGDYAFNFWEDNYEEGTFSVYYQEAWHSTNPPTVELGDEHGLLYPEDLYVTLPDNSPPNAPTLVSPGDGSTVGGTTSATLRVSVSDPDGYPMEVKFYNANGDVLLGSVSGVSSGATVSKSWSGLTAGTTYNWYATANDNAAPNADAGGPYFGVEDEEITFNGAGSSDSDGSIVGYRWDFEDDGTYDTDWSESPTATHIYSFAGDYTVKLQVKDDDGATDTDTAPITIREFNNPPTTPDISGPQAGSKNIDYEYTAVSTDADDDTIQYLFDWDDGTNTTTDFYANGTAVSVSHNWSTWGFYTLSVTAYDDQNAASDMKEYAVLIDVIWVKDIGYLIDTDSDGTYDSFYSNETGSETAPEKQDDGTYLINSDGIEGWDWVYDPETDTLTPYSAPSEPEEDWTWLLYILIIVIIILLLIAAAIMGRKKPKEEPKKEPKKPTKSKSKKK
jgi:hypothetical protein